MAFGLTRQRSPVCDRFAGHDAQWSADQRQRSVWDAESEQFGATATRFAGAGFGFERRLVAPDHVPIFARWTDAPRLQYVLSSTGPTAEQLFGNRGFLLIYILGGLLGSLVELVLGNPVLGASGSIMALIGALAGLGMSRAAGTDNELTREMIKILLIIDRVWFDRRRCCARRPPWWVHRGRATLLLVEGLRRRRAQAVLQSLSLGTDGVGRW